MITPTEKLPKAQYNGELELGGFKITCAVLNDTNHTRVLSERSLANALGVKGSGMHWQRKKQTEDESALLPEYVSQNYLKPFISAEIRKKLIAPIQYISKSGVKSNGALAEILPDICDIWIRAIDFLLLKNLVSFELWSADLPGEYSLTDVKEIMNF